MIPRTINLVFIDLVEVMRSLTEYNVDESRSKLKELYEELSHTVGFSRTAYEYMNVINANSFDNVDYATLVSYYDELMALVDDHTQCEVATAVGTCGKMKDCADCMRKKYNLFLGDEHTKFSTLVSVKKMLDGCSEDVVDDHLFDKVAPSMLNATQLISRIYERSVATHAIYGLICSKCRKRFDIVSCFNYLIKSLDFADACKMVTEHYGEDGCNHCGKPGNVWSVLEARL